MDYELGDLAQRLGRHMAEQCTDGLPRHFRDDLLAAFPDEEVVTVRSALAELNGAGLVTLNPLIGPKLPSVHTTLALFVAADAAITGHDPVEDSVVLARMLIDDPELGHVPGLEEVAGWPRRRFNPALGLLMPLFRKGRYREVYQPDYPTLGLIVGDDEIVALRRYARDHT
ncbi:MAG: hypothetical protein KKC85_23290 [Gammaproteobacteria bacterium]|nr:hypothetical protein [Gammaproteobacteria bacterium]